MKTSHLKSAYFILLLFLTCNLSFAQCYQNILSGSAHFIAQKQNGTLWGWGYGNFGQLANTIDNNPTPFQLSTVTDWSSIHCGGYNTYAIKNNGTLWGTGNNQYGCLGINSSINAVFSMQQIGTSTDWLKITPSEYFTVALKTNGTLWAWGQNTSYQMGNNMCCTDQLSPVQVGTANDWVYIETGNNSNSAFAIKSNGTLWGWGLNLAGLLGPSNISNRPIPTQLNGNTDWASINVGGAHALALKTNGTLWSWGAGGQGQTGDGLGGVFRSTPVQIGSDTWVSVSGGYQNSFGVKSNGTLWAWGLNSSSELGLGNSVDQNFPSQIGTTTNWVSVHTTWVSGVQTTIAIKSDGTVWGWGDNSVGQLGNGTNTNQLTPIQLTNICVLGNEDFVESKQQLILYPNPARDLVTIQYDLEVENASVELFDISGRIVYKKILSSVSGELQINTNAYQSGIYIVIVKQNNKVIQQEKLIIE